MGPKENKVSYLHYMFLLFLTYRSSDGFDYFTVAYQWPRTFQQITNASIYVIFTNIMKIYIDALPFI